MNVFAFILSYSNGKRQIKRKIKTKIANASLKLKTLWDGAFDFPLAETLFLLI
jgi:hypothetical protein